MTDFKKAILFVHRWLGFISGLVVFIVSLTGCLFCFQDEIQDALHNYRHVQVKQQPYLLPTQLQKIALQKYPKAKPGYTAYYGKDRPALVIMSDKAGFNYVYLNPYDGKIVHTESPNSNFFIIVEYIHLYLLLPSNIGSMVVGVSVIIFVVLMITGIVLWWPKRKSDRKRSFTIKWGGRWRRVNYDLHNVLGFYAASIALILALTGLSITFEWMRKSIYLTANLGREYTYEEKEPISDSTKRNITLPLAVMDRAYQHVTKESPKAEMIGFYEEDTAGGLLEAFAYEKSLHYAYSDLYDFDRYTGKLLRTQLQSTKSLGKKLNDMNYDIHVGQIAGLPGKIIAFLASLICASLPITGFIVWLGKRKKPKKLTREVTHRRTHKRQLQAAIK